MQQFTLSSPTGAELNAYCLLREEKPKAIVQINHGMAEHAARYERFMSALVEAGFGAYAHDHRGHGSTKAPEAFLGHFGPKSNDTSNNGSTASAWDLVLKDTACVEQHIADKHPGVPIITFGHSMGAIIAFSHFLSDEKKAKGVAVWNSGFRTGALGAVFKTLLKAERFFKGSDVPSRLAMKLTFEDWNKKFKPNHTDFDWLSQDEAEVDKYVTDPLCGFPVTIGLWLDVLEGIYHCADNTNLAGKDRSFPIHLLGGGDDPCSENGKALQVVRDRLAANSFKDVTLELLPNTRHESLNEINRDATTAKFIHWLNERWA